jgi:hypothetical protein
MGSLNIPGNFKKFSTTTSINISSITYSDNLSSERKSNYFFSKSETQSISATISTRFKIPLKTSSSFNRTKILTPFLNSDDKIAVQENSWTSVNTSATYSFFNNKLRIRSGIDFTSNGMKGDLATKLYGSKFGGDWDIFDKLTLSLNSSIRLIDNQGNKKDDIDNDQDGDVDELRENWSISSSGINLTLGYKF